MAFRLEDVKKTVRARSDGMRYVHPRLLDPAAVSASVTLAQGYLGSRLGRTRREVDPDMMVRFFGDPRIARGLLACLSVSFRWRTQEFAEVLPARDAVRLAALGLHTPGDLRLFLFDVLNRRGDGFLELEHADMREEGLRPLARRLRLTPAKLDQLVALDAEENAVLVRIGRVPTPEQVVALYNYQCVDALLRNSACINLTGVGRAARTALEAACILYDVPLEEEGDGLWLRSRADPFGSYARFGVRLTRALYSAAVTAPALLASGRAQVHLPGRTACYLLERETARALTGGSGRVRQSPPLPNLREAWALYRHAGGSAGGSAGGATDGWRLLATPEPALTGAGLALAPLACRRGETTVYLWSVDAPAARDDVLALHENGLDLLAIVADESVVDGSAMALPREVPVARAADGVAGIIQALTARWDGVRFEARAQALDGLLAEVEARGFVPEAYAAEALGCAAVEELAPRLRELDPERYLYVPGLGLCSPAFAAGMRKGLRRRPRRASAA